MARMRVVLFLPELPVCSGAVFHHRRQAKARLQAASMRLERHIAAALERAILACQLGLIAQDDRRADNSQK